MKTFFKFLFIILLSVSFFNGNAQKAVKRYINKYQDMAVQQMKKYDIPASVILGVSIVESGAGQSKLATIFHNHFGVKGKNSESVKKLGYKSSYKEYASDEDSYEHFCKILAKKRFYEDLKGEMDYKDWLNGMNKANYSEAKGEWVRKVSATIKQYQIYQFDEL
jgi:flagellum-specific peptidoglycan hydrolase FlgJ